MCGLEGGGKERSKSARKSGSIVELKMKGLEFYVWLDFVRWL